ncbi:MAG: 2-hydroxyhepta-2,4-diene-1,7-dioate isomerase [Chitinophagales bacterium]|nr:MAG: 2-hydroxyhepta-2,4-diene-1,7-dioate isomerase [Chitinophagales bacterium]
MKVICVGRNYAEHARELKNAVPDEPVIFMKPSTALIRNNKVLFYPQFTRQLHYEGELVLKICKNGKSIEERFAHRYFDEITVGIDFTARDIQAQSKTKGLPWETAKAFDGSAAVGNFVPLHQLPDLNNIHFSLLQNGKEVQKGTSADMLFSFTQLLSYISRYFTLLKGDLLFTGTPAGVGEAHIHDTFEGYLEGTKVLTCKVK